MRASGNNERMRVVIMRVEVAGGEMGVRKEKILGRRA